MSYQNILVDTKDGAATITINRPPMNVMNIATMREMGAAIKDRLADPGVKILVITASGNRAFSAGVDVADHVPERMKDMLDSFDSIITSLLYSEKLTLAVVNGMALGGGLEVILCCDMVLASEKAAFAAPEIKLGMFAGIGAILLARLAPMRKAIEIICSGDNISAREAEIAGLVNKVVPEESLEAEKAKFIARFTANSGIAMKMAKKTVTGSYMREVKDAMHEGEKIYEELMKTEDAHEGMKAFMEKRKPVWKNR